MEPLTFTDPNDSSVQYTVVWQPHPGPQTHLVTCPVHEICFGGARGGGKTDGAIGKWIDHANRYGRSAHGVFFRRRFKQLEEVLKRTHDIFPKLGAEYSVSTATWTFPNGATLKLRHLWDVRDAEDYQGHQYTFLVFEEATNWPTSLPMDALRGTLRSAAGVQTHLILTSNPGGPGHNWVKARYVTPNPRGYQVIKDPETQSERVFIPSKLDDNPSLMENDPTYKSRLKMSGPPSLVRAWLMGDWDIVAGGFFDDVFRADRHILPQFQIPKSWQICISFDWGSSKPASLGIFARVTDPHPQGYELPRIFPRGSLIRVNEWYTVQVDEHKTLKPNVGRKLSNEDLGAGIARRVKRYWGPKTSVADPSIFTEQGGPSIYEQMKRGARSESFGLIMNRADNNRITGWHAMRDMIEEAGKDTPEKAGLWITENCEHWIRTVPVLQCDTSDPDDVDTDAEDHAADDTRYCVMAKPRVAHTRRLSGY